ncbi:chorismate mutase [Kitasatospora albolonga]
MPVRDEEAVTSDVTAPVSSDVITPVTSDVTAPVTSDVTAPVASDVTVLRADIDLVDAEIRALVARRGELSRAIQRARIAGGGRRTDLARETRVITPYTQSFGRPGTAIALALLEICRGTKPTG